MPRDGTVTRTQFEQALTPDHMRTVRRVHLGFMMGPCLFAALVGFLAMERHPENPGEDSIAVTRTLSLVHLGVAVCALAASRIVPNRIFSAETLAGAPAAEWVRRQQTAAHVRLGLVEGAALLGLVTCLIAVESGVLPEHPVYWLNLGSLVALQVVGMATFPNRDRWVDWFERRTRAA